MSGPSAAAGRRTPLVAGVAMVAWLVSLASLAALAAAAGTPRHAAAQDDYRHLDQGRPLRVEDAYPIKLREWEWELGSGVAGLEGGDLSWGSVLELKTGLFRNGQFGVETHFSLEREDGVSRSGIEEVAAHILYNLNQEGRRSPALAFRADLEVPGTGDVSGEDAQGRLKAMLTRTLGRTRAHVNGGYRWASAVDGGEGWEVGLALDRALGLTSRLIAGDVFIELPSEGEARVWVDLGTRIQMSKRSVLDVGVFARVDDWTESVPNLGFTVGLSRAFGIRSLVPLGPYPNPRLR